MLNKSIKEIETLLFNDGQPDPVLVEKLKEDRRKGVQHLLKRFEKQERRIRDLRDRFCRMSIYEQKARRKGASAIAGVDEVGRGPLAGPVVAAAVILPEDCLILGLDDSKKLSEQKREELEQEILKNALSVCIGISEPEEIDRLNIYQASRLAMKRAVEGLDTQPDHLLVDAVEIDTEISQEAIIKGDGHSVSIAAASIIAKVKRDRLMKDLGRRYPGYGFEKHMGYPTSTHLEALEKLGPAPFHRRSFGPVKNRI
ncbi:ribonuclease HII [Bacillus marinisedimentorum]|uniref:ribonuclease HII n=1 Tax=Bacillus marinisedimentorum TaxID=1821260 RepID=UPI000B21C4FD